MRMWADQSKRGRNKWETIKKSKNNKNGEKEQLVVRIEEFERNSPNSKIIKNWFHDDNKFIF